MPSAVDVKRGSKTIDPQNDTERLYAKIGQLNMELEWLKKSPGSALRQRQSWVDSGDKLSVVRQCQLVGIARSTVYASKAVVADEYELILLRCWMRNIIPAIILRQPEKW